MAENVRDALLGLAAATAEAVAHALESLAPEQVERDDAFVVPEGLSPFESASFPAIALSALQADGAGGGFVFLAAPEVGELLATAPDRAVAASASDGEPEDSASEAEGEPLLPIAERLLNAAAGVTGLILGQQVEIEPAQVESLEGPAAAAAAFDAAPHATLTPFRVAGHSCTLIQLLPDALAESLAAEAGDGAGDAGLAEALGDLRLRVWAEIGRTRVPLGRALELPPGAVVELDRAVDDPVEIFVNGLLFGRGSLVITDDGEWAIRLSSIEPIPLSRGPHS